MANVWIITVQPLCCVCWSLELRWNLLTSVTETQQRAASCCRSSRLYCTFNNSVIKVPCALGPLAERHASFEETAAGAPFAASCSCCIIRGNRSFSTSCWLLLSFINSTTLSAWIIIWFWSSPRFPRRPVLKHINISRQRGPDRQQGKLAQLSAFKRFPFQRRFKEAREGYRDRWRATGEMRAF